MMMAYARRMAWQADVTAARMVQAFAVAMGNGKAATGAGGGVQRVSSDELLGMMGVDLGN